MTVFSHPPNSVHPPPRPLLTNRTVSELHGKIKCVKKLMEYPRASIPELKGYLQRLLDYFTRVLSWTYMSKNKECSAAFMESWRLSKQLEEVVIRTIVIEEDSVTVWRSIWSREKAVKETSV